MPSTACEREAGASVVSHVEPRLLIAPSAWGKLTTLFQISLVFTVMLQESLGRSWPLVLEGLVLGTAAFTALSGFLYVRKGFALFPQPDEDERQRR